ncbi:MAG: HXXEE domain-containing protein [Deltaproteobacteria bacterium]|nr:HXXEE domain-containing protein [Deltaproteobacteria bacterium]
MLWLPFGQYEFLVEHWMKIGTYAAPFLLFGVLAMRDQHATRPLHADFKVLSVGLLVAYILHQYEEHWIDFFGNHYAFLGYINGLFARLGGCEARSPCPLTPAAIFVINTSLVWLVGVLAIWRAPSHLFPALAMAGIVVVNAVAHIAPAVLRQEYNPGLLTALVLFIPAGLFFYRQVVRVDARYKKQAAISVIWAVLAHVLMVGGMLLANLLTLIPESVYFLVLIAWSCVPLLLFRGTEGEPVGGCSQ